MCHEWYIAQKIYNAGHRKQIEGENTVDPKTVGHFTGMHDKNGKPVIVLKGEQT